MRRLLRALLTLLAVLTLCACGGKAQDGSNGENAAVAWDFDVPEDGLYAITDKGLRNSRICESSLPYSVRLRCDKNLAACNRHLRRKSQVKASTEKRPNGTYTVRLELSDDMGSVMDLRLAIPREDMAAMLTERFQKSPERLYGEIMRTLMSSEPEDEAP